MHARRAKVSGSAMSSDAALRGRLAQLAAESGDQKAKVERYKAVFAELVGAVNLPHLKTFVEHVTSEEAPLVVSRQVLQELAAGLPSLPAEQLKELGAWTLERIAPRAASFEEQASTIRERLAEVYEAEEDWSAAAKMLAGIPLDSGIRVLDDTYKVEKLIKISMLYLQVRARSGGVPRARHRPALPRTQCANAPTPRPRRTTSQ